MSRRNMPAPDAALKRFFKNPAEFAALFNGAFFHGEAVIVPEKPERLDSAYAETLKGKGYFKLLRCRDIVYRCTGILLAILGIENQNRVDHSMPVRIMTSDSLEYAAELGIYASKEDKKNWTFEDLTAGIPKGTKIPPVITIVFYTGENPWDGPRSIYDTIDVEERFRPLISDYRIHVVDLGHDENLKFPDSSLEELRRIMQAIYVGREEYVQQSFQSSMVSLAGILAGNSKLYRMNRRKEPIKMCEALDRLEQRGVEKGILIGEEKGLEKGILIGEQRKQAEIDLLYAKIAELEKQLQRNAS